MATQHHNRILIIDDSEITLRYGAVLLEKHGYEVRTVSSVDQFDEVFAGWSPEIILCDVQMPDITGVELTRELKSRYETAHVPIILFSSLPMDELEVLARECDADGYLSKADGLDQLPEELAALRESMMW